MICRLVIGNVRGQALTSLHTGVLMCHLTSSGPKDINKNLLGLDSGAAFVFPGMKGKTQLSQALFPFPFHSFLKCRRDAWGYSRHLDSMRVKA